MGYFWAFDRGFLFSTNHITQRKEEIPMEKDIRERIALKRYQIISPVLADPTRASHRAGLIEGPGLRDGTGGPNRRR